MEDRAAPAEAGFEVRAPAMGRAWTVLLAVNIAFMAFWTVACIGARIPACVLILGGTLALTTWAVLRRRRLCVLASEHELVIRNWHGSCTVPREDVVDFRIETPSFVGAIRRGSAVGAPVVHAVKQDGSMLPLHATGMKFADPAVLEANHKLLCGWLRVGG